MGNRALAFIALGLLLSACGEGADSVAGVEGDKKLVDLDDAELDDVCTALTDNVLEDPDAARGACIVVRLGQAALSVPRCNESIQSCPQLLYFACPGAWYPSCAATVADLSRCVEAERARLQTIDTCQQASVELIQPVLVSPPAMSPQPKSPCDRVRTCWERRLAP